MGFERNNQIKNPSNQLNIKYLFLHSSHFERILYFSVLLFSLTYILISDFFLLSDSLFKYSCFVPIMVYHNARTDKSRILSDNKSKAGIYMWVNTKSGKIYIGSALNLSKRFYRYFSVLALKRDDSYICRALLHYTHSAFSLHIIEYIDITSLSSEEARIKILEKEQFYLDIIFLTNKDNIFNINPTAGSSLGYKHSPESLAKISGKNHPMYGKTHSAESLALMSEALSGENNPMFGKSHSAETLAKMSSAHKGKTHSAITKTKMSAAKGTIIYVYNAHGILVNSFCSGKEAAKYFECSYMTIYRYTDKNKLFRDQWILSSSENNSTQKSD